MKALAWFGSQDVRIIEAPVPDITEPDDVILKVTGTTICGSDLHLYHGEIVTLQKGDILGHGQFQFHHKVSSRHRLRLGEFERVRQKKRSTMEGFDTERARLMSWSWCTLLYVAVPDKCQARRKGRARVMFV